MTGFAAIAEEYGRYAAVIPCGGTDGKHPMVAWRGLSRATAAHRRPEWKRKFADANVGIVTGPSKITVVDVDQPNDALHRDLLERFGDTPLQARTPRGGWHLFYRSSGEPTKAKLDKLPVDIRGRGGFIVVPPSTRQDGARYEFLRGAIGDLDRLPPLRDGALVVRNRHTKEVIGIGHRNETVWLLAMTEARSCVTRGELLSRVLILNRSRCEPPIEHEEVERIVASAWTYQQRGQEWVGQGGRVYVETSEIERFAAEPDALAILVELRRVHLGFRESFAVSPRAMAAQGLFSSWTEPRIRKARDRLVDAGRLHCVHPGGRGKHDPALFAFPSSTKGSPKELSVYPIVGGNRTTKKSAPASLSKSGTAA